MLTFYDEIDRSSFLGLTWERFAQGRMIVGLNSSDGDFNAVGKSGGEKTHKLTVSEMPSHNHNIGTHVWDVGSWKNQYGSPAETRNTPLSISARSTGNTGGGNAHNNMPPYLVASLWRRVA